MELREGYTTAYDAKEALRHYTQRSGSARPGDMLVWDKGTSSREHSRPEEWPALLITIKVVKFAKLNRQASNVWLDDRDSDSSQVHSVIMALVLTRNMRLKHFNARFVRLPKGMQSVGDIAA